MPQGNENVAQWNRVRRAAVYAVQASFGGVMLVQAVVDLVFAAAVGGLLVRIQVFGRRRPLLAIVMAALFAVPALLWAVGAVIYAPA